jgi:hypothetical protein
MVSEKVVFCLSVWRFSHKLKVVHGTCDCANNKQGKNLTKITLNTMSFGQGVDLAGSILCTNVWDSKAQDYNGHTLALT